MIRFSCPLGAMLVTTDDFIGGRGRPYTWLIVMNTDCCPLCYTPLEVCEVAPCARCGHLPKEIEHALTGVHTYSEMRFFGQLSLVLCNFCMVDFGSQDPTYFGLPPKSRQHSYEKMEHRGQLSDIYIGKDKYCPACGHRLPFLEFVAEARQLHLAQT